MQRKVVANDILIPEIARLVSEGSQVTMVPKGNSMLPFIHGGRDSIVLVRPDEVDIMDIVLAKVNATYVIHRVIAVEGEDMTLMGDGNIVGVEHCRRSDILAKVVRIKKDGRDIDCTAVSHRRKARIWKALKPFRRYILAIYRRVIR